MKVVLDGLPPEGRTLSGGLDDAWFFEAVRVTVGAKPRALSAELHVARVGAEKFQVTGTLSIVWHVSCDRCVRVLRSRLEGPLDLTYQRGSLPTDEDLELAAGDLDIGWIEGGSLVLADVVSEQVSLWLPDRQLCGGEGVERVEQTDTGPCELPEYDHGPDLKKKSSFSALANWKPSH
jgi:uncharacterized metal-binding protein YceD (DUF177 family)